MLRLGSAWRPTCSFEVDISINVITRCIIAMPRETVVPQHMADLRSILACQSLPALHHVNFNPVSCLMAQEAGTLSLLDPVPLLDSLHGGWLLWEDAFSMPRAARLHPILLNKKLCSDGTGGKQGGSERQCSRGSRGQVPEGG